jgi:hypothetical protein
MRVESSLIFRDNMALVWSAADFSAAAACIRDEELPE